MVAVSEPVDPTLLDYSMRLLRALEWDGLAMVEFRHDRPTGETALMEVNGRFWGSLPLNTAAGCRLSTVRVAALAGDRSCAAAVVSGRASRALDRRARSSAQGTCSPSCRTIALASAMHFGQLIADFAPGTRSAMWSWRDPRPAVQEVLHVLSRWVKDAVKWVLRAIIPRSLLAILRDSRLLPAERRAHVRQAAIAAHGGANRAVALPPRVESVLFVCHGNIMRSAAAAGFLREELRAAGITNVRVASAGTHAHDGRPRMRARRTPRGSSDSRCAITRHEHHANARGRARRDLRNGSSSTTSTSRRPFPSRERSCCCSVA